MKTKLQEKLKKTNIVIVAHIFATGPALELEEYLHSKVNSLLFIGHPFSFTQKTQSFFRYSAKGEVIKKDSSINTPNIFLYFKEIFYTLWWCIRFRKKNTLFIGSDNFSAYLGLILKNIGVVSDVILYTIDFVPKRFGNPLLNFLYHFFDKQCLKYCKIVWNVSEKITEARKSLESNTKQIIVPLGMWYDRIPDTPFSKRKKNSIVFMGHILDKQGVDLVIKSLPKIKVKVPKVSLTIIGTGPYEEKLKKMAAEMKLKNVNFLGYVSKHEKVEKLLSQSVVSVATYKPDPESFTYFADPGKIKNYLGAGLPVFVTDVPAIAKRLEKEKCGIICKFDVDDFSEKMTKFLLNTNKLKQYSKNARKFSKQFDWNIVFSQALESSLL